MSKVIDEGPAHKEDGLQIHDRIIEVCGFHYTAGPGLRAGYCPLWGGFRAKRVNIKTHNEPLVCQKLPWDRSVIPTAAKSSGGPHTTPRRARCGPRAASLTHVLQGFRGRRSVYCTADGEVAICDSCCPAYEDDDSTKPQLNIYVLVTFENETPAESSKCETVELRFGLLFQRQK